MADIKRLLNKKSWTGRELGILELTNMAAQFKQIMEHKPRQPLIPKEEFKKMANGLTDTEQIKIYNGYISIHEWLSVYFNSSQTFFQQAQLQILLLDGRIRQAIIYENVHFYIESLPEIMTAKQYEETRAAHIEKSLQGDEYIDAFGLIEMYITYYLNLLRTEPRKSNPLKAIRKKYLKQPVKSKIALSHYNEAAGLGYRTLEDGRRSDKMTTDEWQAAVLPPEMLEAINNDSEISAPLTGQFEKAKVLFMGGTEEEAEEAARKARGIAKTTWHYYEEPPKDINKWDIIEEELLDDIYINLMENDDEFPAAMEEFAAEFKELVAAAIQDIDSRYFKGEKGLAEIPVKEWLDTHFSYKLICEKNIYDYRKTIDRLSFEDNTRALIHGVAILDEDTIDESTIDERGYYIPPEMRKTNFISPLDGYLPESENYAENIKIVEEAKNTLFESYYYLMGYNYAIDRIASIYDIPDITIFKADLDLIKNNINLFNESLLATYILIKGRNCKDKDTQEKWLQVLKDVFSYLDIEKIQIPEENKVKAEELLKDIQTFGRGSEKEDLLIGLLLVKPRNEREEDSL